MTLENIQNIIKQCKNINPHITHQYDEIRKIWIFSINKQKVFTVGLERQIIFNFLKKDDMISVPI